MDEVIYCRARRAENQNTRGLGARPEPHLAPGAQLQENSLKKLTLARLAVAAALSAAFVSAHAGDAKEQAANAALADGLTTAFGLAAGAVELNPLGPIAAVGLKAVTHHYAQSLPDTERPAVYAMAASMWSGAAANNVCVAASILTGGALGPACVAIGVAWGLKTWKDTEHERQFWESCAMLREYAKQPELQCVYTRPPEPQPELRAEATVASQELQAP